LIPAIVAVYLVSKSVLNAASIFGISGLLSMTASGRSNLLALSHSSFFAF